MKRILVLTLVLAFVGSVQADSIWVSGWGGVTSNYTTSGALVAGSTFTTTETNFGSTGIAISQAPGYAGDLLLNSWNYGRIFEYTTSGSEVQTAATWSGATGQMCSPQLNSAYFTYGYGLAVDNFGRVWATGYGNQLVAFQNFAGGGANYVFGNGHGVSTPYVGIGFDSSNNAYALAGNGNVYKAAYDTGAGSSYDAPTLLFTGGAGSTFGFGIHNDNIYISDAGTNNIYEYTLAGAPVTTISSAAGSGLRGMAWDSAGNMYGAYNSSGTIGKFVWNGSSYSPDTTIVTGLNQPSSLAIATVPEPATLVLLGLGALALRRKK